MAGNISNSNIWNTDDKDAQKEVHGMFSEMVEWAVDEGADMLIGETFYYAEEAYMALDIIQKAGHPSVITIAPMAENVVRDGVSIVDTMKELEQRGADVVGITCEVGVGQSNRAALEPVHLDEADLGPVIECLHLVGVTLREPIAAARSSNKDNKNQ